jgi:hypothetical protein
LRNYRSHHRHPPVETVWLEVRIVPPGGRPMTVHPTNTEVEEGKRFEVARTTVATRAMTRHETSNVVGPRGRIAGTRCRTRDAAASAADQGPHRGVLSRVGPVGPRAEAGRAVVSRPFGDAPSSVPWRLFRTGGRTAGEEGGQPLLDQGRRCCGPPPGSGTDSRRPDPARGGLPGTRPAHRHFRGRVTARLHVRQVRAIALEQSFPGTATTDPAQVVITGDIASGAVTTAMRSLPGTTAPPSRR